MANNNKRYGVLGYLNSRNSCGSNCLTCSGSNLFFEGPCGSVNNGCCNGVCTWNQSCGCNSCNNCSNTWNWNNSRSCNCGCNNCNTWNWNNSRSCNCGCNSCNNTWNWNNSRSCNCGCNNCNTWNWNNSRSCNCGCNNCNSCNNTWNWNNSRSCNCGCDCGCSDCGCDGTWSNDCGCCDDGCGFSNNTAASFVVNTPVLQSMGGPLTFTASGECNDSEYSVCDQGIRLRNGGSYSVSYSFENANGTMCPSPLSLALNGEEIYGSRSYARNHVLVEAQSGDILSLSTDNAVNIPRNSDNVPAVSLIITRIN